MKAIMLPAEGGTGGVAHSPSNRSLYIAHKETKDSFSNVGVDHLEYHIYIIDEDAEIKTGDWCIHLGLNRAEVWEDDCELDKSLRHKVICSTDKSLKAIIPRHNDFDSEYPLELLSDQSLRLILDYHCKNEKLPSKINVEYETYCIYKPSGSDLDGLFDKRIKLNSKGVVDITIANENIKQMTTKEIIFEIKSRFELALDAKTGWGKEDVKALYSQILIEVLEIS